MLKTAHYEEPIELSWTEDIETILSNLRANCVSLSTYHKLCYIELKSQLKWFRIPTIILSGITSVISVGLQPYCEQQFISVITCLLSLTCGIITSLELYLSIQTGLENELVSSREYHILGLDIYKVLSLRKEHRPINGSLFLNEVFSTYEKLVESGSLIEQDDIQDRMVTPDKQPSPHSHSLFKAFSAPRTGFIKVNRLQNPAKVSGSDSSDESINIRYKK